jgi:hypothetical protein
VVRIFHCLVNNPVSRRLRCHQEEFDQNGKYMSVGVNNKGALPPKSLQEFLGKRESVLKVC